MTNAWPFWSVSTVMVLANTVASRSSAKLYGPCITSKRTWRLAIGSEFAPLRVNEAEAVSPEQIATVPIGTPNAPQSDALAGVTVMTPISGVALTVTATVTVWPAASRTVSVTARSASTLVGTSVMAAPATTCVTGSTVASEVNTWNGPTPLLMVSTTGMPA